MLRNITYQGADLSLFDVVGGDEHKKGKPYKTVVMKVYDVTGDGGVDMFDVAALFKSHKNKLTELYGDGTSAPRSAWHCSMKRTLWSRSE